MAWLGFPGREHTARDLLGWLVDNQGVDALAKMIEQGLGDLETIEKETAPGPGSGAIDLLVETTTHVIGVEVKVKAGLHGDQLFRYAQALAGRAEKSRKKPMLLLITEVGLKPEYPGVFEAAAPIAFVARTWDRLEVPGEVSSASGAPFAEAWRRALADHRRRVRGYVSSFRLGTTIPLELRPPERWMEENLYARAMAEFAEVLAIRSGLEVVMSPRRGANGNDMQCDLAKSNWTIELGHVPDDLRADLAAMSPFRDDLLRFAVRIRLHLHQLDRPRFSVRLGTTTVPYLNTFKKSARPRLFEGVRTELALAHAFRRSLVREIEGADASPVEDCVWQMHRTIYNAEQLDAARDQDRVELVLPEIVRYSKEIDKVVTAYRVR